MPNVARKLPDYDKLPTRDYAILKQRARSAWQEARSRSVLSGALIDRLWSETLIAVQQAPLHVRPVLAYRSEVLFKLLVDRARWLDREDQAPPPRLRIPPLR
jgi:hypothetical protein